MLLITFLACMDPKIDVHVDITRQKGFGDTGDTAYGDWLLEPDEQSSTASKTTGVLDDDKKNQDLPEQKSNEQSNEKIK
ncbi:MAG: hypothetical protein CMK59_01610 [Proteobacteria bacterium]|nr:hypothetical protein [Pseudomonadota bacterium]